MPVLIDRIQSSALWAGKQFVGSAHLVDASAEQSDGLTVALMNNMPDSALEDTERQFIGLLNNASGNVPVHIKLYSLPNIPRGELGQQHLSALYSGIDELLNSRFDGLIVTGTEPLHSDLRAEPYWSVLTTVLDWAEQNTSSTVLSCLAAHAGVLHSGGIPRHRLPDKQFGVFEYRKSGDHFLTQHILDVVQTPHSRWNEVREDVLVGSGYTVLASSVQAGVNSFVKKKRDSLFVHFQGHPEYGVETLLKEYRRDIRRFLRHERETYPAMPSGYFNASATRLLSNFQANILPAVGEQQMASFPEMPVAKTLINTWALSSVELYRNWLQYLLSRKSSAPAAVTVTQMTS